MAIVKTAYEGGFVRDRKIFCTEHACVKLITPPAQIVVANCA
ncbi:MAG: hypothetical protein RLZZ384_1462, partial [Pseudomonadota bacterium]